MPRKPRLDVAEALYHVIARGVARHDIFYTDYDRRDFIRRLANLQPLSDITLFAYALMDNHFHLVLRRGASTLGLFMRRLLTGYAVSFNRRHDRVGHLFQNRYKAIVCEDEEYLLDLVRYVHLNPVRARIVDDPAQYRWSSHTAYLRQSPPPWLDTRTVLALHGGRRRYLEFVRQAMDQGRRSDLSGAAGKDDERLWHGNQILGRASFARRLMPSPAAAPANDAPAATEVVLAALAAAVESRLGVAVGPRRVPRRSALVSRARRELVAEAVLVHGLRPVDVSRFLGISTAAVSRHLRALESKASRSG